MFLFNRKGRQEKKIAKVAGKKQALKIKLSV
jgi:hypothetical protein